MSGQLSRSVIQDLETLFERGCETGLSDADLVDRFVRNRDEAAFRAIVTIHGPMVLGVCRRILSRPEDVDDAVQATFLVFIQNARSLRDPHGVGGWLHGVAVKVAARCRRQVGRSPDLERLAVRTATSAPDLEAIAIVDEELSRLPAIYRDPIVLCHVEGHTHDQAALQLGWPVGTVRSRLARGRDRLRIRLTRRGLAPSVSLPIVACPSVPRELIDKILSLFVNTTSLAPHLLSLSHGVVTTMMMTSLVRSSVIVLGIAVGIGGGALIVAGPFKKGEGQEPSQNTPKKTEAPSETLTPFSGGFRATKTGDGAIAPTRSSQGGGESSQGVGGSSGTIPEAGGSFSRTTTTSGTQVNGPHEIDIRIKNAILTLARVKQLSKVALTSDESVLKQEFELDMVHAVLARELEAAQDEVDRLESELDYKLSQVELAEARLAEPAAYVAMNTRLNTNKPNTMSPEEIAKADGELQIAQAGIKVAKADLARTAVAIRQANRRAFQLKAIQTKYASEDKKDLANPIAKP